MKRSQKNQNLIGFKTSSVFQVYTTFLVIIVVVEGLQYLWKTSTAALHVISNVYCLYLIFCFINFLYGLLEMDLFNNQEVFVMERALLKEGK